MKKILCSPTEPKSLVAELGKTSGMPEPLGVDFLWRTEGKWYGVQRKQYPNDLEASMNDGRLAKELGQMAELEQAFFILEGYGQWTISGKPMGTYDKLTKEGMFGLLTSVAMLFGIPTYRVRDQAEMVQAILALKKWTESPEHQKGRSSLNKRPTAPKNKWGHKDNIRWANHFLQGFNGIGPVQAAAILEHFEGLPLQWTMTDATEFEKVPGIGPKTATALWEALK